MTNVTPLQRPEIAPGTFDEFWAKCPALMRKRSSRAATEILWTEITTTGRMCNIPIKDGGVVVDKVQAHLKATPTEIMDGLKRYIESEYDPQTFKYSKYLIGASVFLNQGKWES